MSAYRLFALAAAAIAPAVFAAAPKPDIENGKTVFAQQCGICHSVDKAVNTALAPNLVGVVGRKAGTSKDFPNYSAALKGYAVTWSVKALDEFLVNPVAKVPGTTMPMLIQDNKIRADVVAYLASLKK
jgi:cytochrome c